MFFFFFVRLFSFVRLFVCSCVFIRVCLFVCVCSCVFVCLFVCKYFLFPATDTLVRGVKSPDRYRFRR